MEASTGPPRLTTPLGEPSTQKIKQKLLQKGVIPTPKIIHTLRKKELQKSLRKSKRRLARQSQFQQPLTHSQKQADAGEAHFQTLKAEYRNFTRVLNAKTKDDNGVSVVGKPWERLERVGLRELAGATKEYGGRGLRSEHLRELSEFLETERHQYRWLLDDDIELEEGWPEKQRESLVRPKRRGDEAEAIRFLVDKLSCSNLNTRNWKFSRMMKRCGLQFTEGQLLRIVEGLGDRRQWKHALSVVEWVYNLKEHRQYKSRFVYTKLLTVLGKARRPHEAIQIFNLMRGDCQIYPDMPAYHSVAVTLGQAGFLKELISIIDCMKQKPSKKIKNIPRKNWDPVLHPDVVVFNAVLNACVPSHQWKGVSWVFEQLRKSGLRPNGATYGLAMEVMLHSGKYDRVYDFYGRMRRSGEAPTARTYRILVRAFWEEGKLNEAIQAVMDLEQKGVVGTACVYYELACCLSNNGRWQEAIREVEKMKKLPRTRPLEVTFTGLIMSSMDGGHVHDCLAIFEHIKACYTLDIGIINAMLKVYRWNDMFSKAKELFEDIRRLNGCGSSLRPDVYTYGMMLEASASAQQWEYFEFVYREMALSGYQLDQNKYAKLLVEASRAGKWHLLEHAFDTMLEAGEIPPSLFFTELVCQGTAQHDYERVVSIVSSMIHAPFQVSEKQWTDLFAENGDWISSDSLKELLNVLSDSDISREATVSNLLRSLLSLCDSENLRGISSSVDFGEASVGESHWNVVNGRFNCNGVENMHRFSGNVIKPCKDLHLDANDNTFDILSVSQTSNGGEGDATSELNSRFLNYDGDGDGKCSLLTNLENLTDDEASDVPDYCFDYSLSHHIEDGNLGGDNKLGLDNAASKDIDTGGSNLPSADEILEIWKECRKKDGIFFLFQHAESE